MGMFPDSWGVTLTCQDCGTQTQETVRWVKENAYFTCRCGTRVSLRSDKFLERLGLAKERMTPEPGDKEVKK